VNATEWTQFQSDSEACRAYQRSGVRTKMRSAIVQIVPSASGDGSLIRAALYDAAGDPTGVRCFGHPDTADAFLDGMIEEDGGLL